MRKFQTLQPNARNGIKEHHWLYNLIQLCVILRYLLRGEFLKRCPTFSAVKFFFGSDLTWHLNKNRTSLADSLWLSGSCSVCHVMATSQDVEFQGLHFHACTTNGLEETVLMLNELLLYLRSSKRDVLSGDKNIGNKMCVKSLVAHILTKHNAVWKTGILSQNLYQMLRRLAINTLTIRFTSSF